jgi:hypothetical protein
VNNQDEILLSIFYPHKEKCTLVTFGVLPLLRKERINLKDYFFSTYKGEGMVITLKVKDQDISHAEITNHFTAFFEQFPSKAKDIILPVNQIFIDSPMNSFHIWDHDPFYNVHTRSGIDRSEPHKKLLSEMCLGYIEQEASWDIESSFRFFMELFILVKHFCNDVIGQDSTYLFESVHNHLKMGLKSNTSLLYNTLDQGKSLYKVNEKDILAYSHQIREAVINKTALDWAEKWRTIIELKLDRNKSNYAIDMLRDLIFNTAQKIDLLQDGLIRALGVCRELHS